MDVKGCIYFFKIVIRKRGKGHFNYIFVVFIAA